MVLGFGFALGGWEYTTSQRLANDVMASMDHDPLRERPADVTAPLQLARLTAGLGAYMDTSDLGEIVHARRRDVDCRHGAHFVIERGDRRATVFLLADARIAMEHQVQSDDMHGVLIPTDGGVPAVFCPDRRMLTQVLEDMRHSLQWHV